MPRRRTLTPSAGNPAANNATVLGSGTVVADEKRTLSMPNASFEFSALVIVTELADWPPVSAKP